MDNFDLRSYLSNNPLLKENQEFPEEINLEIDKLNLGMNDNIYNLAKKIESDPNEIYDFGGGNINNGFDKTKITIIDLEDIPKDNPNNKIHDLNSYIKLSPKKMVIMSYSFYNFPNQNLKKTIDDCLKPGGYVVIKDYIEQLDKAKNLFNNYDLIYEYTIKTTDPDEIEDGNPGWMTLIFKK